MERIYEHLKGDLPESGGMDVSPERIHDLAGSLFTHMAEGLALHRPELDEWIGRFEKDRREAALDFWYEMHKGAHESLLEF